VHDTHLPEQDDDDDVEESETPFLLTRRGTAVTLVAVGALYVIVVMMPIFGGSFAAAGRACAGGTALVCTGVGRRIAGMAPSIGATAGLLVAMVGSFLPPLRDRRRWWLLGGYGLVSLGLIVGFLVAATAP